MKLSEIHAAIEAGNLLRGDQAFATLVAIEHLARIEGVPISALDFSAPRFVVSHPYHRKNLRGSWLGRAQYLSWRNFILNAQMLFAPGDTDADPWLSLGRAERLSMGKKVATLYNLRNLLPAGTLPCLVTNAILIETLHQLSSKRHIQFRAGVNSFRRLFKSDIAQQSGLLPAMCPERLPVKEVHQRFLASFEIETLKSNKNVANANTAITYVNRLAIAAGLLNGTTDTLDDLRRALPRLPLPTEVGLEDMSSKLVKPYVSIARRVIGGRDFRLSEVGQAWADLRTAARAEGCDTSFLWALGKPATARDLFPWDMSETAALAIIQSYSHRSMWTQCRRGCEQFDALRGEVSSELLPPEPIGVRRPPPRPPRQPKPRAAWGEFYASLREKGWNKNSLNALSYLRVRAIAAGYAPHELTQSFIDTLQHDITEAVDRTRLRVAVLKIARLSKDSVVSNLPALCPPEYTKFTLGAASPQARVELEELLEFMNAAASTRRGLRAAVGVFTDAIGCLDTPLRDILKADMSAYDLGPHESRRKIHTDKIRNLRDFTELAWTPAWRELQKAVVGTGITALDNPVPKVLSWNPGTDPESLTKEWAQRLDRDLRSTLTNPPHGRADLALTLARHLRTFDALHYIPEITSLGLLPPQIGPIR